MGIYSMGIYSNSTNRLCEFTNIIVHYSDWNEIFLFVSFDSIKHHLAVSLKSRFDRCFMTSPRLCYKKSLDDSFSDHLVISFIVTNHQVTSYWSKSWVTVILRLYSKVTMTIVLSDIEKWLNATSLGDPSQSNGHCYFTNKPLHDEPWKS